VPGFAVFFPARIFADDVGVQAEAFAGAEGFDGQEVPHVEGDDVGHEEIDVVGGVAYFAFAVDAVDGLDVVAAGAEDLGAFELHAPEAGSGVEDEIVAIAVSPGLGEVEAERAEIGGSLVQAHQIVGYKSAFDGDHGSGRNPLGFVVMGDVQEIGGSDSEAQAEG